MNYQANFFAKLLNLALKNNPEAKSAWQDFSGKRFAIRLQEFGQDWYFLYENERFIALEALPESASAVFLNANIAGLLNLLLPKYEGENPILHLNGDVRSAQQLQNGLLALKPNSENADKIKESLYSWLDERFLRKDEYKFFKDKIQNLRKRLSDLEK